MRHVLATDKTLRDLGWASIVSLVASRCSGPMRDHLENRSLELASDPEGARVLMAETAEAMKARADGDPLPLTGLRDARPSLLRVVKGGALTAIALADLLSVLGAARGLRRFLARRRESMPRLYAACALDPSLDSLEEEIDVAIDRDGTVKDDASPELRRLRLEVANLRARIVARLAELLLTHADVVSDRFHTERDGRYVIPMRTDAHDRIPGIVHGTSGSGATVFVEPRALVEQQNRLTLARGEMEAEESRILGMLSVLVGERAPELGAALDALDRADVRDASGRLGLDLDATVPTLSAAPSIEVRAARHPLLVLEGHVDGRPTRKVVANDLALSAGHGLVLSGPNAGGKTVALKLLGLFALMARAGLPVPAQDGATVGFFDPVLSDVGDEQSLEKSLSTFSAHVSSLARILDAADARALVLLDEVATGTDPEEGAALASAVVTVLADRGAAVAVTTHYEGLKALALTDDRFTNASVGFDVERMAPTFELRMGVPGASSALAVARRFGLDASVLARAEALVPERTRSFDALTRRLEAELELVKQNAMAADAERVLAAKMRRDAEGELRALKERERTKLTREGEKVLALLRETREEIRAARAAMRKSEGDAALVEAAKNAVDRAHQRLDTGEVEGAIRPPPATEERGERVTEASLTVGERLWVPRLRTEVEIVERPSKGRARVQSGAVKLWVDIADLRRVSATRESEPREREVRQAEPEAILIPTSEETLDLRGLRVDEALGLTESFLDRVYGRNRRVAFLVHGVGTGALRDAVREHLRNVLGRYVKSFRPGTLEEGGDRITVVILS